MTKTHHDEHAHYPREDWRYEVCNQDTTLGYWEWVEHKFTSDGEDECKFSTRDFPQGYVFVFLDVNAFPAKAPKSAKKNKPAPKGTIIVDFPAGSKIISVTKSASGGSVEVRLLPPTATKSVAVWIRSLNSNAKNGELFRDGKGVYISPSGKLSS